MDFLQPCFYRLEKRVAGRSIPKAHIAPNRQQLASLPLDDATTTPFDHSAWDRCLKAHVTPGGAIGAITGVSTVDYDSLSADPDFDLYLTQLADAQLDALSSREQLALWINAYNALCALKIVQHAREHPHEPRLASITHLRAGDVTVWNQPAGVVCGMAVSLNEVEHNCLRSRWAEPAVHGCIVCASASCPDLRAEAFVGARLEEQMREQMEAWLTNPTKGLHLEHAHRVRLSRIFLWFEDDFGGAAGARAFVAMCKDSAGDADAARALGSKRTAVRHFAYDWSVNRSPPRADAGAAPVAAEYLTS
jgi:hypothetical protein